MQLLGSPECDADMISTTLPRAAVTSAEGKPGPGGTVKAGQQPPRCSEYFSAGYSLEVTHSTSKPAHISGAPQQKVEREMRCDERAKTKKNKVRRPMDAGDGDKPRDSGRPQAGNEFLLCKPRHETRDNPDQGGNSRVLSSQLLGSATTTRTQARHKPNRKGIDAKGRNPAGFLLPPPPGQANGMNENG